MNLQKKKIILNWLPPATVYRPSIAFSVLKSYLKSKDIVNVDIKYWNIILDKLYARYQPNHHSQNELLLLPFLYILAQKEKDLHTKNKIMVNLQARKACFNEMLQTPEKLNEEFMEMKEMMYQTLESEYSHTDFHDILIFGISAKFYQWIPGMILAEFIKEKNPEINVVIGGMGDKDAAVALMKTNRCFDFAIWGEGEIPLACLYNKLRNNEDHYEAIDRIAFRRNGNIHFSEATRSEWVDLSAGIVPDFSDYFQIITPWSANQKDQIEIPLESSRGCYWNKCRFCYMNKGYRYREKDPSVILNEISTVRKKYGVNKFAFHDNNIAGAHKKRFSELLDKLIDYNKENSLTIEIVSSDIIHKQMDAIVVNKMKMAGFSSVLIGFEETSDNLLKKMNKQTSVADNVLFVKLATKYKIHVLGNIIPGILNETEQDITESIRHIHFFRFFTPYLSLSLSYLSITAGSDFYDSLDETEKSKWRFNQIYELLPGKLIAPDIRFHLFAFFNENYNSLWQSFIQILNQYSKKTFRYELSKSGDAVMYKEFYEDDHFCSILFDEPVYWNVLEAANEKIISFGQLFTTISSSFPEISEQELKEIISRLRKRYILFTNGDLSEIISVIDTNTIL